MTGDFGESGCAGKASFNNQSTAQKAAARGNRNKNAHLNVYRCKCGSFHVGNHILTTKPKPPRQYFEDVDYVHDMLFGSGIPDNEPVGFYI